MLESTGTTAGILAGVGGKFLSARLQLGNQAFRLPHIQAVLDDAFGG